MCLGKMGGEESPEWAQVRVVGPRVTASWCDSDITPHTECGSSLTEASGGEGGGVGFRRHRQRGSGKSLNPISSDATDLLSASMFVKSPAEFIPIQDESSNFGHVAGKHCLHA